MSLHSKAFDFTFTASIRVKHTPAWLSTDYVKSNVSEGIVRMYLDGSHRALTSTPLNAFGTNWNMGYTPDLTNVLMGKSSQPGSKVNQIIFWEERGLLQQQSGKPKIWWLRYCLYSIQDFCWKAVSDPWSKHSEIGDLRLIFTVAPFTYVWHDWLNFSSFFLFQVLRWQKGC